MNKVCSGRILQLVLEQSFFFHHVGAVVLCLGRLVKVNSIHVKEAVNKIQDDSRLIELAKIVLLDRTIQSIQAVHAR